MHLIKYPKVIINSIDYNSNRDSNNLEILQIFPFNEFSEPNY